MNEIIKNNKDNINENLYIGRESALLEFNRRVLRQGARKSLPLLERLKFMAIFYSNTDEFFMVRAGKLCRKGGAVLKPLYDKVREISASEEDIFKGIMKELSGFSIELSDYENPDELEILKKYFMANIKPVVSPLVIDMNHPFPFVKNNEVYLCCVLETKRGNLKFGIVPFSGSGSHFIYKYEGKYKLCIISELAEKLSAVLFSRHRVLESYLIRVTRNADIQPTEGEEDDDFKNIMTEVIKKRKRLQAVRLVISDTPSEVMKSFLLKKLKLEPWQVFIRKVPLDFSFAFPISARLGAENPELVYSKYKPVKRLNIKRGGLIDYIKKNDILLYYPYDSIQTFIDLLYEAGNNPDVVSVKISLYRVANKSRIVSALAYAAEQGKEVICVLELRARFDEENNINYAEVLEASGCTVIYGLGEYKVHAKLCHITLRKPDGEISFITQIGTGNYNEKTCEQYTDLSLITADYDIGLDGAEIFGALCEGEVVEESGCLWVGPKLYLPRLGEEIEKEIQKGEKGRIRIKINAMNNVCVMDKLCEASKAGVKIDLMIRGLCCLPPGIKNISENIRVKSAVGKYLEHSRILCFGEGDEARLYIGSGDFLTRNLLKRVEVFVPIKSHDIKQELIQILDVYSADSQMSYFMKSDGSYVPLFDEEEKNTGEKDAQTIFEDYYTKNSDL